MKEPRLFTPGPTNVPGEVREVLSQPMIHHRSEEFQQISKEAVEKLNWLSGTSGASLVLSSSGTGAMEAAVGSLFAPGDEVVCVVGGKFGERWLDLARHFKLTPIEVAVEWGKSADIEQIKGSLTPKTKGVLIQACESSTGVFHPIRHLREVLSQRSEILLVVDAITALGVHDLDMDRDGIDALLCASQKALMGPPGLSTVSLSPKAIAHLKKTSSQSYYFSLQQELKAQEMGNARFTPAIALVRGLVMALTMIHREGKEALYERHRSLQSQARGRLREMGFELFNHDKDATWGITTVASPKELNVKSWISDLKKNHGLWIAGGQGELEGKIFRLSHMGACYAKDLDWALARIEESRR